MGKIKLKAGLRGLKKNKVYNDLVEEFNDALKEMNEIYDLVVEYPFAGDIKEKLLMLNKKFKTLQQLLKDLKEEKEEMLLFRERLRKKLNEMGEKVRKISTLVTLHQYMFDANSRLNQSAKELKKIISVYNFEDLESIENKLTMTELDLSEEEKKIDAMHNELEILSDLLEQEFKILTEKLDLSLNEIEELKRFVQKHDQIINEIVDKMSILELLEKNKAEILKANKQDISEVLSETSQKSISSKNKSNKVEETSKKSESLSKKDIKSEDSSLVISGEKTTLTPKLPKEIKDMIDQIRKYENILSKIENNAIKDRYLLKIEELKEKMVSKGYDPEQFL